MIYQHVLPKGTSSLLSRDRDNNHVVYDHHEAMPYTCRSMLRACTPLRQEVLAASGTRISLDVHIRLYEKENPHRQCFGVQCPHMSGFRVWFRVVQFVTRHARAVSAVFRFFSLYPLRTREKGLGSAEEQLLTSGCNFGT